MSCQDQLLGSEEFAMSKTWK